MDKVTKNIIEVAAYVLAIASIPTGLYLYEEFIENPKIRAMTRKPEPQRIYKAQTEGYTLKVNYTKRKAELKTDKGTINFDLEKIVQD